VDAWHALYLEHTGVAYGWQKKAQGQVQQLLALAKHAECGPVAEVMRRARILFQAPPGFLARDSGYDLGTLVSNWNKLAQPARRGNGITHADMLEAERRAMAKEKP
jgi:hypothetical protein